MREIVENDPKGRYEIKAGKIRARYSHSFEVSLDHEEDTESRVLYHGTPRRDLRRIMKEGLKTDEKVVRAFNNEQEQGSRNRQEVWQDIVLLIMIPIALDKRA